MLNKEGYLIRKFYSETTVAEIDRVFEKAAHGGPQEKFDFAMEMLKLNSLYFAPSHTEIYRQALAVFEEAGNQGHVPAMEAAISLYARGEANSIVETTHSPGWTQMVEKTRPDFYKAKEWAIKAVAAGSKWAAEALPHLDADIARVEAEKGGKPGAPSVP